MCSVTFAQPSFCFRLSIIPAVLLQIKLVNFDSVCSIDNNDFNVRFLASCFEESTTSCALEMKKPQQFVVELFKENYEMSILSAHGNQCH